MAENMSFQDYHDAALDRLTEFKKSFEKMIATSDTAYERSDRASKKKRTYQRDYTPSDIKRIVASGDCVQQAKLSEYFFNTNGLYKRIILHYSTFLTYSWILTPYTKGNGKYKISDKAVSKTYYDAAEFCTNFQIERKCATFAKDVFVYGAYYGLVIDDGSDVVIQDLPFEYCRTRFKDKQDIQIIEFNLDFFKQIREDDIRKEILSTYPKEIQLAYKKYAFHNGSKWCFIPTSMGIYFCFFEEHPFFLDLIPLLDTLDDYKEIDKQRNIQALRKILVQEVPHDGTKLVFEPPEAEIMHDGTVNMVKGIDELDVVTSYAKVSLLDMSSNDDKKTEISDMQDLIYSSAGVSKELFFASTDSGIQYSINNDLALVMILGHSFAHFFTILLNNKYENKKIKFKLIIVPLSYYNSQEFASRARENASFGYSFITPVLTTGLDQTNLAPLKLLENDLLDLDTILKPLQSSYTQSGKKSGEPIGDIQQEPQPEEETTTQEEEQQDNTDTGDTDAETN